MLDNYEGKHLAFLRAPQYFGETAILEARRRTASIQALTYADLYYLLAASMQVILRSFKEDDERIHMNALEFLDHGSKKNDSKQRSTYAYMNKKELQQKREKLLKRINSKHENVPNRRKERRNSNYPGIKKQDSKDDIDQQKTRGNNRERSESETAKEIEEKMTEEAVVAGITRHSSVLHMQMR